MAITVKSNKPLISRRHFIKEPSCSFEGDVTTDHWILIIRSHGSLPLFDFHVQSLSVGKYYTSLLKSHICTNYCCINKEINILHYDANELNVFDISWNLSWPLLRLCYCLHYDVTGHLSQIEAVNFETWSSKIFPEYLIRLTFKLNISKKTEPKRMRPIPLNS